MQFARDQRVAGFDDVSQYLRLGTSVRREATFGRRTQRSWQRSVGYLVFQDAAVLTLS